MVMLHNPSKNSPIYTNQILHSSIENVQKKMEIRRAIGSVLGLRGLALGDVRF